MILVNKKDTIVLARISYIYYPVHYCKDKKNKIWVLFNFNSKVNTMASKNILKLGF